MAVTFPAPLNLYLPLSGGTMTGGLTVALGTITADQQNFSGTATWNNAGVTFTALKLNVTSTASAAASLLMDLQVGGASKFSVSKSGDVNLPVNGGLVWNGGTEGFASEGANNITFTLNSGRRAVFDNATKRFYMGSDYSFGWAAATTTNGGALDTAFSRISAGLIGVGTSAAGSVAGSMSMTNLTLAGTLTVPGVTTAALTSTGTFTSGAGAQVGTLTNAPAAGNPTSWIKIVDNGTTRYIPAW